MESLGRDLARIRKEQNRDLKDIENATKIPLHILQSIENGSIFADLDNNPTYIRSYVRSFAKALSIDESAIISALDDRQNNQYEGELQKYLEEKPKRTFSFDEQSEKQQSDEKDEMIHDHSPEYTSGDSQKKAQGSSEQQKKTTAKKDINSIDWSNMGQEFRPRESTKSRVWIVILAIIVIAALSVYFFFFNGDQLKNQSNRSENTEQQTKSNTDLSTDSLQLNIVPSSKTDSMQQMSRTSTTSDSTLSALPDTLSMLVYAAYDKLDPVRVSSDIMKEINPYWIEKGMAYKFNFVNEINIRGPYKSMELIMNGHPIRDIRTNFYNSDTRILEIKRSFFTGDSTWLHAPPDSIPISAPSPEVVKKRPNSNN